MDPNDFPASVCTSKLCEKGYMYIKLQLYCNVREWVLACLMSAMILDVIPCCLTLYKSMSVRTHLCLYIGLRMCVCECLRHVSNVLLSI